MSGKITTVFLAALAVMLVASIARAESTTLYVQNDTKDYVTVNVDGNYGCSTAADTTCSIPVSVGSHNLHATRHDTGATKEITKDITSSGYTWDPW